MLLESDNPFSTGGGDTPKKIIGQQQEQRVINSVIAAICSKPAGIWGRLHGCLPSMAMTMISVLTDFLGITPLISSGILEGKPLGVIKLIGPRGMGKTTLLDYAHKNAEEKGVHVVRLGHLEDMDQESSALSSLIDELKAPWWNFILSAIEFRFESLTVTTARRRDRYERLLRRRLASRPVLFLLDDAQLYQHNALRMMIRSAQQLLSQGYRVAMILTGTPQLTGHLMDIEVPSINRGRYVYVSTLDNEDARKALFDPFHEIVISDEVAKKLDALAACYPYFIQITGFTTWSVMAEAKATELDDRLFKKVERLVEEEKHWFLLSMYEQLDKNDLIPRTRAVLGAVHHSGKSSISKSQMVQAVKGACQMGHLQAWELIDKLLDLGVLNINEKRYLEVGIPGFFDFLNENYKALPSTEDRVLGDIAKSETRAS